VSDTGSIEYVQWEDPSCPKDTAKASFITSEVSIETVMLWRAEFRIPPGHAGLTGIALLDSSGFILPYDTNGRAWLVGDDDLLEYNYGKELGSNVKLALYNTDDTYEHGWQVRLIYTPMSAVGTEGDGVVVAPFPLS
jgi:hypothetical protein